MSRYAWIVLDADNTIFDFDQAEYGALSRTLAQFGIVCTDSIRSEYAAISARLWRAFERGALTSARLRVARFEELLRFGRVPTSSQSGGRDSERALERDAAAISDRYIEELGRESGLLEGAEAVVRSLVQTHRLLLATNGIADIQRRRFGASVLRDCFEDIVISDEIGVAKPDRGYFDEAFRRMGGPDRGHVLMVGDSLSSDIAGGIGYGIDTCWFDLRGQGLDAAARHLPPLRPTYRITDLGELLRVVSEE